MEVPFVRWLRRQLPWNDPDVQRMNRRTTRWTYVAMVAVGAIGIWSILQGAWGGWIDLAFVGLLGYSEWARQANRQRIEEATERLLACMNQDMEEIFAMGNFDKCPACPFWLREDDLEGQAAHMEAAHPEIVAERRAESERWAGWEDA